jgi:hypothetical protein
MNKGGSTITLGSITKHSMPWHGPLLSHANHNNGTKARGGRIVHSIEGYISQNWNTKGHEGLPCHHLLSIYLRLVSKNTNDAAI